MRKPLCKSIEKFTTCSFHLALNVLFYTKWNIVRVVPEMLAKTTNLKLLDYTTYCGQELSLPTLQYIRKLYIVRSMSFY